MASEYSYRFTETAKADLSGILQYIDEELCNRSAAAKLADKVFESIDNILAFTETGKLVENEYLQDKTVRRVLIENYTLYYKVDESNKIVYIVRLVYGKRDLNMIMQSLNT